MTKRRRKLSNFLLLNPTFNLGYYILLKKKNSKKKKNSFRLIVLEYTSFVRVSERNNTQKTHNTQRAERERERRFEEKTSFNEKKKKKKKIHTTT